MDYEERLCFQKLPTLVYRRHMGDLIEMFKMLNRLSWDIIPQIELRIHLVARYNRGHSKQIWIFRSNTDFKSELLYEVCGTCLEWTLWRYYYCVSQCQLLEWAAHSRRNWTNSGKIIQLNMIVLNLFEYHFILFVVPANRHSLAGVFRITINGLQIEYEVYKRKIKFLQHVVVYCDREDPVLPGIPKYEVVSWMDLYI